jgi:hypothetical protein
MNYMNDLARWMEYYNQNMGGSEPRNNNNMGLFSIAPRNQGLDQNGRFLWAKQQLEDEERFAANRNRNAPPPNFFGGSFGGQGQQSNYGYVAPQRPEQNWLMKLGAAKLGG